MTDLRPAGSTSAPPRHPLPGRLVWVVAIGVAVIVALVDQATKVLAVELLSDGPVDLGFMTLRLLRNPNAAFGIPGFTGMFLIVTVVVVVLISRLLSQTDRLWLAFGYGLVLGGAFGNGTDRALRDPGFPAGKVVDFFDLGWFPVFNIADSAITVGVLLVIGLIAWRERQEAQAAVESEPAEASVRPDTMPPQR